MGPVPCDDYWKEAVGYSHYTHPFHVLNKPFPQNHYRNLNTTSNDVYGSVWRILNKEDPDLDPAGVSTGVHGRMMKMGQIPFNIFDEVNAQLRGRSGFGDANYTMGRNPEEESKKASKEEPGAGPIILRATSTPQLSVRSGASRAGSAIVSNVASPVRMQSVRSTGSGRVPSMQELVKRTTAVPALDMQSVRG